MSGTIFHIDSTDPASVQQLIDAFHIYGTPYESAVREVMTIHNRPFDLVLTINEELREQLSPLHDAFSFDMETDELLLYSDEPETLIDGLLEMALFLRGFNTIIGVDDDWKTQVAIGAWRKVRDNIKDNLMIDYDTGTQWSAGLDAETVKEYNAISFGAMVFLASRPEVDVVFPEGTNQLVSNAYERLTQIIDAVALNIGIDDHLVFNRRLSRALLWIEDTLLPKNGASPSNPFGNFQSD
jgi:hypothetical protein